MSPSSLILKSEFLQSFPRGKLAFALQYFQQAYLHEILTLKLTLMKEEMMKQICILLAYLMMIAPGCKAIQQNSTTKDLNVPKWNQKLKSQDPEVAKILSDILKQLKELTVSNEVPLVVINKETLEKRNPTQSESVGWEAHQENEEMFLGSKNSRFIYSVLPIGMNRAHKDTFRVRLLKHDSQENITKKNNPEFNVIDGSIMSFELHHDRVKMEAQILTQVQKLKSMFGQSQKAQENSSSQTKVNMQADHRAELDELEYQKENYKTDYNAPFASYNGALLSMILGLLGVLAGTTLSLGPLQPSVLSIGLIVVGVILGAVALKMYLTAHKRDVAAKEIRHIDRKINTLLSRYK